jgi:ABC-type transporter MlaC component
VGNRFDNGGDRSLAAYRPRRRGARLAALAALLLGWALIVPPAAAWYGNPGYVPLGRDLPNAVDLMESGLYWLQDLSGVDHPRDPASIIALMEDQAARFFDFAYIAYLVAGPEYTRRNVQERAHFQNRIRDQLFTDLARKMGMYDVRMPSFTPLVPRQTTSYSWTAGGVFYHRGGPYIRLEFQFYLSPQGWRIYDVTSNGASAADGLRRAYFAERSERLPVRPVASGTR